MNNVPSIFLVFFIRSRLFSKDFLVSIIRLSWLWSKTLEPKHETADATWSTFWWVSNWRSEPQNIIYSLSNQVNKELNINSIWNTFSDCEILHFYAAEISTDGLFQIQGKSDVLRHRNYTVGDGHSQGIQRSTNDIYSNVLTWFKLILEIIIESILRVVRAKDEIQVFNAIWHSGPCNRQCFRICDALNRNWWWADVSNFPLNSFNRAVLRSGVIAPEP